MCRMHNTTSFPNINNIYRHIFAACFFPSLSLSLVVLVHPPTWISLSASTGSRIDLAAPKKSMNYSLYNVWGIEQNKNIAQPTTTTANKQKKKRRWWTEEWQYKKYTNQTHYKQYLNILLSVWHNEHNRSSYLRVCYSLVWLFFVVSPFLLFSGRWKMFCNVEFLVCMHRDDNDDDDYDWRRYYTIFAQFTVSRFIPFIYEGTLFGIQNNTERKSAPIQWSATHTRWEAKI